MNKENSKDKWIIAIILLLLFAPLGIIHIWRNKQVFTNKIYLFLWFYGGYSLFLSIIVLTQWLPEIKNLFEYRDSTFPVYPYIIFICMAFSSLIQIVFGFIVCKKSSLGILPKNYFIIALTFLTINLTLIPLIGIFTTFSLTSNIYTGIGSF